jgi:hypothetical protein
MCGPRGPPTHLRGTNPGLFLLSGGVIRPAELLGVAKPYDSWQTKGNDNRDLYLSTRRSSSVARRQIAGRAKNHPFGWFFRFSAQVHKNR